MLDMLSRHFNYLLMRASHVVLAFIFIALINEVKAVQKGFDVTTLSQLGYSADVADFFSEMRFLPGRQQVSLMVNHARIYTVEALFNDEGQLCAEPVVIETLKLRTMPLTETERCTVFTDILPDAQVTLRPGTFSVEVILPESAFDSQKISGEEYGGIGAVLNYDLNAQYFSGSSTREQSFQAMLVPGGNVSNWVVRNRSYYSQTSRERRLQINETSARRVLPGMNALLEVGQFGAGGSLFSGLPINGAQITNTFSVGSGRLLSPVNGMANSQAMVEVRQRNNIVYRTLVSPGPFTLSQLGNAVGGIETTMEITESDGRKKVHTFTPQFIADGQIGREVFQLGFGQYRKSGERALLSTAPLLLTGEQTIGQNDNYRSVWGGVASSFYQTVMGNNDINLPDGGQMSTGIAYSRTHGNRQGTQMDARFFGATSINTALSLSSLYRTQHYLGPDEGMAASEQSEKSIRTLRLSLGGSVSWGNAEWGRFTYGVYQNHYYHAEGSVTHLFTAARQVGAGAINLSLQRSAFDPFLVFIGATWPLGGHSIHSRLQQRRGDTLTSGISVQGGKGDDIGYSVDVITEKERTELSSNIQTTTPYSRLSGGLTQNNQGSRSFSLGASGALAYANGTAVMSPVHAGETFGVLHMDGRAGTQLYVPGSGSVTTDFRGNALLPSLPAYEQTNVQVNTQTLPLNLRLNSTSTELHLAYGSVATRRFKVTEVKQLLLTLSNVAGVALAVGSSVHDERGRFMGTLMSGGTLLLVNEDIGKALEVRPANAPACRVIYEVPDYFDPEALYEETVAVCQ
ncbi:fimbria/pilus outer membrane usher protein [Serratia marcescens]